MLPARRARVDALAHELGYVAKRRLPQVFKDVSADRGKYPVLARVVTEVEPGLWAEDPTRALLVAMRRAVAALPDETAEGCAEGRTWPQFGRLLYFGSEVNSSLRIYDDYVAAAEEYSGRPWSKGNFKRHTHKVRVRLAAILLDIEQSAIKLREQSKTAANRTISASPTAVPEPPFIPRPSLDEQLNRLWNSEVTGAVWHRTNTLCLVGEPGTGKTRYVKELPVTSDAVWINAESADALSFSLANMLEPHGIPTAMLDTSALKREFAKLLARPEGPKLVVIDGINDPQEIDIFLPLATPAQLIITSRTRPADDWAPILHVGEMAPNEAAAMVQSLLPTVGAPDAANLAASLGCRPLAIEQTWAFLSRSPKLTVAEFASALARDVAVVLQSLPSRPDAALTVIYRRTFATLRENHPVSYQILEVLAFLPPLYIPRNLIMGFLAQRLPIEENEKAFFELSYAAAIAPLRETSLLEETDLGIRINSLTQGMLQDVAWPHIMEIIEHYKTTTEGIDTYGNTFDLYDFGWTSREIASMWVIDRLFFVIVDEVAAAKSPAVRNAFYVRKNVVLSTDEWSALTEALWVRTFRAFISYQIIKPTANGTGFEGTAEATSLDEILGRLQPYIDQINQIESQIPDTETDDEQYWYENFDPADFWDWFHRTDFNDPEGMRRRLTEDYRKEMMNLVTTYMLQHKFNRLLADDIVETRLGQYNLRELHPRRKSLDQLWM